MDALTTSPHDGATLQLATMISGLTYSALPAATVTMARHVILDTVGCMLGALDTAQARALFAAMDRDGGSGRSTVVGRSAGSGSADAAYANALLAHVLELDDTHRGAIMHVAAPVVSAALAAAEAVGASGQELILAIVGGYEAATRVALAIQPGHWYKGFLSMATCGAMGAAAAAGMLNKLDADGMAQAMGLAAIQASGLNASIFAEGDMGKATTPAAGAMNGLRSANLVAAGLSGPTTILEGRFGVFHVWADQADFATAMEGAGQHYEIDRTGLKPYSCCRYIHGPLELLAFLMQQHRLDARSIAAISVRTYEAAVVGRPHRAEPLTLFDAKMSIPYCLAVLVEAGRFDEGLMEAGIGRNDSVTRIASTVSVAADDAMTAAFPQAWPSSVEVTDTVGCTVRAELSFPKGEPENPLTEMEIMEKFLRLAGNLVDRETALRIAGDILHIDRVGDIRPWLQSLNRAILAPRLPADVRAA